MPARRGHERQPRSPILYLPVGPRSNASRVSDPATLPLALIPRPCMMTCQFPPSCDAMKHRTSRPRISRVRALTRRARRWHESFRCGRPGPRSTIRSRPRPIVTRSAPLRITAARPLPFCNSMYSAPGVRSRTGTDPNAASAKPAARAATVSRTRTRRIRRELSRRDMRLQLPVCKKSVKAVGQVTRDGSGASAGVPTIDEVSDGRTGTA